MTVLGTLAKHGNTITDLSFHEQQTHLITTCSYDHNIHIWDIRYSPLNSSLNLFLSNGIDTNYGLHTFYSLFSPILVAPNILQRLYQA